jgi:hypothetical protein
MVAPGSDDLIGTKPDGVGTVTTPDEPTKIVGVFKIVTVKGVVKDTGVGLAVYIVSGEPCMDDGKSSEKSVVEARSIAYVIVVGEGCIMRIGVIVREEQEVVVDFWDVATDDVICVVRALVLRADVAASRFFSPKVSCSKALVDHSSRRGR